MDQLWWKQITKARIFRENIVNAIISEKSVVLSLPRFVPWYDTLFGMIEEDLNAEAVQRSLETMKDDGGDPGKQLLEKFCKKEVRAQYRVGKTYAQFLAAQRAITLNSRIVWVRGLTEKTLPAWLKFVSEYNKALPKNEEGGIFVLELRKTGAKFSSGGFEKLSFDESITPYDKYTFCILASSETNLPSDLVPYFAELVSRVCSDDVELCALCIRNAREFAEDPEKFLRSAAENECHSDGSALDLGDILSDIEKKIWECQIRTIFPEIESYRGSFVARYNKEIAKQLPITDAFGETLSIPEDVELGQLYAMTCAGCIQMRTNNELGELGFYKESRNALAHLQPLSFKDVQRILK